MENHAKYGNTIYYHGADSLYVNLFIASQLTWKAKGLVVRQETQFPESDVTTLKFKADHPVQLALNIRHPAWAVDGVRVSINGENQKLASAPGSYFTLHRQWQDGDVVKIELPMSLHTEDLPGVSNNVALLYGPLVLAGELGTNDMPVPLARGQGDFNAVPDPAVPVLVCDASNLLAHLKPVTGRPLTFRTQGIGQPNDVTLAPFYQIHRQRYSVYWDVLTESQWQARAAALAAAEARRIAMEKRTVDVVHPGEHQSEIDHQVAGEKTEPLKVWGRSLRHATDGGWFSYVVKVDPAATNELVCTWWGDETGPRQFDILVDGAKIASQLLRHNRPGKFWEATYPIPEALTRGKSSVVVKFQAEPGNFAGGLFGLRILRTETDSE
jgi:hypothetical protein